MSSSSNTGASKSGRGSGGKDGFVPPATSELDVILDQYEFIEMLGRGGMGAVYKARQKSLDRLVAIKILPSNLTEDEEEEGFRFGERFQREARAMAKLSHPNIIAVYDFGQASDGQFYFVMEYVEGSDLHGLIRTGELTTAHVSGWMSQICDALQYAHSKGIVHRDIKPANIMITLDGQVKVADFGLAKITGADTVETKLTMTNMAMGTPDYVAPEALEADMEVDHRADLYAVGVMLYEMLTGKVPRGAWKMPSTQIPGLDPRFDGLIERAMDADREGRFQQASEISATLYEIATTALPLAHGEESEAAQRESRMMMVDSSDTGTVGSGDAPKSGCRFPSGPEKAKKRPMVLAAGIVGGFLVLGLGALFALKEKSEPVASVATTSPPERPTETPGNRNERSAENTQEPEAPAVSPNPVAPKPISPESPPIPSQADRGAGTLSSPLTPVTPAISSSVTGLFSGVSFPRDLSGPESKAWEFNEGRIILRKPTSFMFPAFYVPVPATPNHELEVTYSISAEGGEKPYLKVVTPVRDGWISVQVHSRYLKFHAQDLGKTFDLPPADPGAIRRLLVRCVDGGNGPSFRVTLDGKVLIERTATALKEVQNWNKLSSEFIMIGGETPEDDQLAIQSLRVTPLPSVNAPTEPVPLTATKAGEEVGWIDLLTLADVAQHSLLGQWTLEDGVLRSPENLSGEKGSSHATFAMAPPVPASAYELRWRLTRDLKGAGIVFSFPRDGQNLMVQSDLTLAGSSGNGGRNKSEVFPVDETNELLISVRDDLVQIFYNGEMVSEDTGSSLPGLRDKVFFPEDKIKGPIVGIGVCRGRITVVEAAYRVVEAIKAPENSPGLTSVGPAVTAAAATTVETLPPGDPRLAQLDAGFTARYQTDAEQPYLAAVSALNQSYVTNGIARAWTAAQQKGLLDELTALEEEKSRVEKGEPLPPADPETLPDSVKTLRTTLRTALSKLAADRAAKAAPLYERYLVALDAYEVELTKANEIEKALAVNQFRARIAARRDGLVLPVAPAAVDPANDLPNTGTSLSELPTGRVKGYGVRGNGDPMSVDGREFLTDFADHRDVVRVYQAPHWSHALTSKGELLGFLVPPERENRQITAVSLGYFCAMSLRENGTIGVPVDQHNVNPPGTPLEGIKDAISIASNLRAAAILRASGELIVWADAGGSPARVELEKVPEELVSLHSTAEHLMGRDKMGRFHAIHPRGNPPLVEELNAVKKLKDVETSPYAAHWLAMDEEGNVFAGPANIGDCAMVPEELGKGTTLRVGKQLSAVRLESGEWRAWGNTGGGVVEKINALGPDVHDLSMDSFDEQRTKLIWIE